MANSKNTQLGYNEAEYRSFKRHAWTYLIVFSVLYCFLYCMRLNIGSATPYLIEEGWSESTIGIMTGTLFWTYGIGQLISGHISSLVAPVRLIAAAVVLSAAVNFLVATQAPTSIVLLAILWGANGLFQSMGWSPGLATLTQWWPGDSRGFAVGFLNAFSGFGQVAAYCTILISYELFPQLGWRAGFIIPPLFPLGILLLFIIFVKPTPADAGLCDYEESVFERAIPESQTTDMKRHRNTIASYQYILSNKNFRIWLVIAFCSGLARYGLSTWSPLYFTQRGLSSAASVISSLILPVGMGIGTLIVPWLTDRFCPNNRLPAAIGSAVVGAAAILAMLFLDVSKTTQLIFVEALLFVAGFCIYAINGIMFTYATDIGGRAFSGTCSGMLNFSAYLGAAVQAVVYGFILDNGSWDVVFISVALFHFLIAFLGVLGSRKERDREE